MNKLQYDVYLCCFIHDTCTAFQWLSARLQYPVMQKMQNPGSTNGPPMVDGWVVRFSSW